MISLILGISLVVLLAFYFIAFPFKRLSMLPYSIQKGSELYDEYLKKEEELSKGRDEKEISEEEYYALSLALKKQFLFTPESQAPTSAKASESYLKTSSFFVLIFTFLFLMLGYGIYYLGTRTAQLSFEHLVNIESLQPMVHEFVLGNDEVFDTKKDLNVGEFFMAMQTYLQRNPRRHEVWFIYGKLLASAQAIPASVEAYRKAYRLSPNDNEYALALANAILTQSQGQLNEESYKALTEVLLREPQHQSALMILGLAAYQSQEFKIAADTWRVLLEVLEEKPDIDEKVINTLKSSIAQAEKASDGVIPTDNKSEKPVSTASTSITMRLSLATDIKLKVVEGSTLFVFARSPNSKIPVAIKRLVVDSPLLESFPLTVKLSDADSLMPSQKLSALEIVDLHARISQSGQAAVQVGDLEGKLSGIKIDENKEIALEIDRIHQ